MDKLQNLAVTQLQNERNYTQTTCITGANLLELGSKCCVFK